MAIEIFKVKIGIAPIIMNEIFTFVENNTYNLRSGMHPSRVNVHSTQCGTNLLVVSMQKFGILLQPTCTALSTFKNQIKKWVPKDCPCVCVKYM